MQVAFEPASEDVGIFAELDDAQEVPKKPHRKTLKLAKGEVLGDSASSVAFEGISVKAKSKYLLNSISGFVPKGEMLIIMGSSGSGKSTLLGVLGNRTKTDTTVTGNVYFEGKRLRPKHRRQVLSFVAQDSPLLGEYTVEETLWFVARMYFGYYENKEVIKEKIDYIIESIGLEDCRHVVVGNLFRRGLSGGQKKRLSIAIELVASPPVLLLDEPTSGLDSASALGLMNSLDKLTQQGHTIIATIHQPSSKMWQQFNRIMLLAQGKMVYFGQAHAAHTYFESLGYCCPEQFNPADYYSILLSRDFKNEFISTPPSVEDMESKYKESPMMKSELTVHLDTISQERRATIVGAKEGKPKRMSKRVINISLNESFDKLHDEPKSWIEWLCTASSRKQVSLLSSTRTLLHRNLTSLYKNPAILMVRFIAYMLIAIVLGIVFVNTGRNLDSQNVLGVTSLIMGATGFFAFLGISAIPFVMETRAVTTHENRNGAYKLRALVFANTLTMVPISLVLALAISIPTVFIAGLRNFEYFMLTAWLLLFCIETFIHMIANVLPTSETAVATGVASIGTLFLCSGFFNPLEEMSWGIQWIAYANPVRYLFRMFMHAQWDTLGSIDSPVFPSGEAVIDFYGLNQLPEFKYGTDVLIVFSMAASYLVVSVLFSR